MAKKAEGEFNMAAEIRNLIGPNPQMSGREVYTSLKEKFPKQQINEASCSVAFANARKKLGITTVKKKRPLGRVAKKAAAAPWKSVGRASSEAAPAATGSGAVGLEFLSAAKQLLQACNGDQSLAVSALKQVASLQIS